MNERDKQIAKMVFLGIPDREICDVFSIKLTTLRNLKKSKKFREYLNELEKLSLQKTIDIEERMKDLLPIGLERLKQILLRGKDHLAKEVIFGLLDRTGYHPRKDINLEGDIWTKIEFTEGGNENES